MRIELKLKDMSYQLKQSFINSVFGATSYSMTTTKITGFNVNGAGISMNSEQVKVNKTPINYNSSTKKKTKTPIIETASESDEDV